MASYNRWRTKNNRGSLGSMYDQSGSRITNADIISRARHGSPYGANQTQTTQSQPDYAGLQAEAQRSVEEARSLQEASKTSALGYYQPIQAALGQMSPELISSEQQSRMLATRRAELGASGQNLASLYSDPYSGVQTAQRAQIGMGVAGRQANLPIELELEVAGANREAALGLYGAQAGVAGGMAGVQTAYQYDPGLEYIQQLGYNQGYQQSQSLGGGMAGAGTGEKHTLVQPSARQRTRSLGSTSTSSSGVRTTRSSSLGYAKQRASSLRKSVFG